MYFFQTVRPKEGLLRLPAVMLIGAHTVPAFNSCTKCWDSPCIIHNRTPDCHPVSQVWMRPQVPNLTSESSFDSQATCVIGVLGLFFLHVIHGCLYNQALAEFRSTGAGTKCLYCYSLSLLPWGVCSI